MLAGLRMIGFVPTTDFERSKRFYGGVLGLNLKHEDEFALAYEAGGCTLRVVKVESFAPQPFAVLGWEVDNINATVTALRERGLHPEHFPFLTHDADGIWTAPSGDKVAWFKDPDGNTLSISHHV